MIYENIQLSYYLGFCLGFFSSLHCIGMCAGISAFLSYNTSFNNLYNTLFFYQLLYNFGRITAYIILCIFSFILTFSFFGLFSKFFLIIFSNIILILIGLYLSKIFVIINKLEEIGFIFWNKLYPIIKLLIPVKNPFYAFLLGFIWGYIPCGLVYSSLLLSLGFFSIKKSVIFMFFFGLGTMPSMMFSGLFHNLLHKFIKNNFIKIFLGLVFIFIGFFNILMIDRSCL